MEKDVSILLTDRDFQKTLSEWNDLDQERKKEILDFYGLAESEIDILLQVWTSLNFKKQQLSVSEIDEALEETIWKIAERTKEQKKTSSFKKIYLQFSKVAAVLLIPLLIYTVYTNSDNITVQISNDAEQLITVSAQPGTVSNIILPDGSRVFLNSGSSITYPNKFTGKTRDVQLTGEAFFEVIKNSKVPMLVSADNINLKVYGTSFNVNAFPNEDIHRVTLVEGSISMMGSAVDKKGTKELFVDPGQTVSVFEENRKVVVENTDPYPYIAWKDGILVFRNMHFNSVLNKLSYKFNVDFVLKDPSLAQIQLDATFKNENVNEVLRLLSLSVPFRFYYGKDKKLDDGTYERSKIYIVRR